MTLPDHCFRKQTFHDGSKTATVETQNSIKINVGNHIQKATFLQSKMVSANMADSNSRRWTQWQRKCVCTYWFWYPCSCNFCTHLVAMLNHTQTQCEACRAKNKAFYSPESQHGCPVRKGYSRFAFHTDFRYPKNRNIAQCSKLTFASGLPWTSQLLILLVLEETQLVPIFITCFYKEHSKEN